MGNVIVLYTAVIDFATNSVLSCAPLQALEYTVAQRLFPYYSGSIAFYAPVGSVNTEGHELFKKETS